MDQVRGKDSVGIIAVDDKYVSWEKSVIDPVSFLEHRRVSPLLLTAHSLIGHNRAATRGGVTINNAHPFNHGDITLVHNGTLFENAVKTPHFTVDSESIAYALSLVEPNQAKGVIESLDGAYALIWYDARDKSFNICRNEERLLHYMVNEGFTQMYLSSEAGILYAAANEAFTINPKEHIHELPVGVIWKIKTTPKELVREVTPFTPKKHTVSTGGGISIGRSTTTNHTTSRRTSAKSYYERGIDAFLKHFGVARWVKVEVDEVLGHEASSVRTIHAWMVDSPYAKVIINGVSKDSVPAVGSIVEAWVSTLYEDSFYNKQAMKANQMSMVTLTSTAYRKIDDDPVVCANCSGVFTKDEVTYFPDHKDNVCRSCLKDSYIKAYYAGEI